MVFCFCMQRCELGNGLHQATVSHYLSLVCCFVFPYPLHNCILWFLNWGNCAKIFCAYTFWNDYASPNNPILSCRVLWWHNAVLGWALKIPWWSWWLRLGVPGWDSSVLRSGLLHHSIISSLQKTKQWGPKLLIREKVMNKETRILMFQTL